MMEARVSRSAAEYCAVNPVTTVQELEVHLWRQAILAWVVVPCYVFAAAGYAPLAPTCGTGFHDVTLVGLLLFEFYHLYAEGVAWNAVKALLTPPEASVLRSFGVFGRRRSHVVLGLLDFLDNYTDICFPFIARACGEELTDAWAMAWQQSGIAKAHIVESIITTLGFWGCAFVCSITSIFVAGIIGIWAMWSELQHHKRMVQQGFVQRLGGEAFVTWAWAASLGMLPSVTMLCEAISEQRKWAFDPSKDSHRCTQARKDVAFGKLTREMAELAEINDHDEQAKVDSAARNHYIRLLLAKVFIGNVLALWFQSSFLALTFERDIPEARVKVILSMCLTIVSALVRCVLVTSKIGWPGIPISAAIVFFIVWSNFKVY